MLAGPRAYAGGPAGTASRAAMESAFSSAVRLLPPSMQGIALEALNAGDAQAFARSISALSAVPADASLAAGAPAAAERPSAEAFVDFIYGSASPSDVLERAHRIDALKEALLQSPRVSLSDEARDALRKDLEAAAGGARERHAALVADAGERIAGDLVRFQPLREHLGIAANLYIVAGRLSWDQQTHMPSESGEAMSEHLGTLASLAHEQVVSPRTRELLGPWIDLKTGQVRPEAEAAASLSPLERAYLRETGRDVARALQLPSDLVARQAKAHSLGHEEWKQARQTDDFGRFLPRLKANVELALEEISYRGKAAHPYDALLDGYEPGATTAQLTPLFASLRARLVPLLKAVMASPVKARAEIRDGDYDPEKQLAFGRLALEAMGFDLKRGRLDLAAHPFASGFHPSDVRITTRVSKKDPFESFSSIMHEGGHGLYEQGLPAQYYGTSLGWARSMGIHESQSRLWENLVGRSIPFWSHFHPLMREAFPDQLGSVSLEALYLAMNAVKPSLIRTEADELTYNLHIMLRFEIERDLFAGAIRVEDLPQIWRDKMRDYLGVVPPTDRDGVLQDVHWSEGLFGYFPTYTLGNLYSAQFFRQAELEIGDLAQRLARGELKTLKAWLNDRIHRHGSIYTTDELALRVTGEPLNAEHFLSYLERKYGGLYQLGGTAAKQ